MLFEGPKQVSRVGDEVVRKAPGQVRKQTGEPRMYPRGLKGFKRQWINTCREWLLVERRPAGEVVLTGLGDGVDSGRRSGGFW